MTAPGQHGVRRPLGRTGLSVGPVGLGTMQFGWTVSDVAAMRLSDSNPSLERGLTILGWLLIGAAIVLTIMAIVVDTGANPAYNTDRGPVSVLGGRFHWQF